MNTSDFRNLTAYVEMDEAHAVVQSLVVEYAERLEQFAAGESELAGVAAALFPFARSRRGELDAYADVGLYAQFLGGFGNDVYLVEFFHHDEDTLAHLLREQSQLDVALVFISVADDERVALALHGDDGVQFGLGTGFKSEVELLAVTDDFLYHGLHLVHLDGIDDKVLCLVVVFLGCFLKATGGFLNAVVEDVGETQQHRWGDVAQRQFVHDVAQVNLGVVFTGGDIHVAFVVDTKVRGAPAIDVVELLRIFDGPFLHFSVRKFFRWFDV